MFCSAKWYEIQILFLNLQPQTAKQKPGRVRAAGCRHNGKRLLDALSWLVETSQTSITVRNVANSRCQCGYVYSANCRHASVGYWCICTYSAWGFCKFARSTVMGMRRPQRVERAMVRLSRFFFINQSITNEENPEVQIFTMNKLKRLYASIFTCFLGFLNVYSSQISSYCYLQGLDSFYDTTENSYFVPEGTSDIVITGYMPESCYRTNPLREYKYVSNITVNGNNYHFESSSKSYYIKQPITFSEGSSNIVSWVHSFRGSIEDSGEYGVFFYTVSKKVPTNTQYCPK